MKYQKNRKVLMTFYDKDIFPNTPNLTNVIWQDRPTVKVVLFNEKNEIALIGNRVNDFFLLPGGGIENNESPFDGIKRECQEETGCEIEIQSLIGMTEDFRLKDSKHSINYCYSAKVVSYGPPTLTKNETDIGVFVKWFSLSDAIKLFASQEEKVRRGEVKYYNTSFNILRDFVFIHKSQELMPEQLN